MLQLLLLYTVTTTTAMTASTTVITVTSIPSTSTIPCTRDHVSTECSSEVIDPNKCCMCFVSYDDDILDGAGAEWIFCKCGRWLHEDSVEDVVEDNAGDECH